MIKKRPKTLDIGSPRIYSQPVFYYRIANLHNYEDLWDSPLRGYIGTVFSSYDDPDRPRDAWIRPLQSIYGGTFMRGNLVTISYKEFSIGESI